MYEIKILLLLLQSETENFKNIKNMSVQNPFNSDPFLRRPTKKAERNVSKGKTFLPKLTK